MNNEPAFPTTESNGCNSGTSGLTIRDYFAAKVINGALPLCSTYGLAAKVAYMIADAMLKARQE